MPTRKQIKRRREEQTRVNLWRAFHTIVSTKKRLAWMQHVDASRSSGVHPGWLRDPWPHPASSWRGGRQPKEKAERNRAVYDMRQAGAGYEEIAEAFGISHSRARQIAYREEQKERRRAWQLT